MYYKAYMIWSRESQKQQSDWYGKFCKHKEGFLCDTLYHNTLLCKTNPVPSYNKTVQQLRTFTS